MKRKRNTLILAGAAALLGLGLAGYTFADSPGRVGGEGPGWHRGMGPGAHHMRFGPGMMGGGFMGHHPFGARPLISYALALRDELKLTDEQVKKLEDLRDAFARKAIRERAEIQTLGLDLRRALSAEKVDIAEVEKQIRAIEKKRADLRIERLKAIEAGKAVLTAEQLKQLRGHAASPLGPGRRMSRPDFGPGEGMMGPRFGMGPGGGHGMMGMMGPGSGMGPGEGAEQEAEPPSAH